MWFISYCCCGCCSLVWITMFFLFFFLPLCYWLIDLSISQFIIGQHVWVPYNFINTPWISLTYSTNLNFNNAICLFQKSGNTTLRVHGIVNVLAAAVEPEGGAANPSPPSRYRTARGLALSQQAYFRQRYRKHYWSKITFSAIQAVQAARLCIFQYGRTCLQPAAAWFKPFHLYL